MPSGSPIDEHVPEDMEAPLTCAQLAMAINDQLDGFQRVVVRGGYRFSLRYVPAALERCREAGASAPVAQANPGAIADDGMDQFLLRVERDGTEDSTEWDMEALLTWGLEQKVETTVAGITSKCDFAHVESGAPNAPATLVLLGFEHPDAPAERVIRLHGGTSTRPEQVEFRFPKEWFTRYEHLIRQRT